MVGYTDFATPKSRMFLSWGARAPWGPLLLCSVFYFPVALVGGFDLSDLRSKQAAVARVFPVLPSRHLRKFSLRVTRV